MLQYNPHIFHFPSRRRDVYASHGMVSSSHPLASEAGLRILRHGGNAIDACVAMAMVLPVVEPAATTFGSDNFAIVWSGNKLHGMSASGFSPWGLTEEYLNTRGYMGRIPSGGWDSTTLPGCAAGWLKLLREYGTMTPEQAAQPGIELAEGGYPITPYVQATFEKSWASLRPRLSNTMRRKFEAEFFPGGKAPEAGQIVFHPAMAEFLREIVRTEGASLYEGGKIAQAILRESRDDGGRWSEKDFEGFTPILHEPLRASYHGYEICELPPNGQGITALMALSMLSDDFFPEDGFGTPETMHLQMEAIKLAFADSLQYVGDPDYMTQVSAEALLNPDYLKSRRALIDPKHAQIYGNGEPPRGDTCYFSAADTKGNMISMIQSCYNSFGSAVTIPEYGLVLQSRGATFSLTPGHVNRAGPHKRPYQTIIPGFLMKEGRPVGPFGIMGGFMQPQAHLQVMMNLIDFHMGPQDALDAPRFCWSSGRHFDVEDHFRPETLEALRTMGHEIGTMEAFSGGYGDRPFGRGQIIQYADREGKVLIGAADPRGDGCVLGY